LSAHPVQVTRVREFVIPSDPARALELFEPVGETRWAPGWAPRFIHPRDGEAQTGAVFARDGATPSIWMISDYDREARHIVYTVFVPDVRVTRLQIDCLPEADGAKTRARIAYTHTSLGTEAGDAYLRMFTDEHYEHEMQLWQHAIAEHLAGRQFRHH
jgi:hypothetical protein